MSNDKRGLSTFGIGQYNCILRALPLRELELLSGGAQPYVDAEVIERTVLLCLVEPEELRLQILNGTVPAQVPIQIYNHIVESNSQWLTLEGRNARLNRERDHIDTDALQAFRAVILASGILKIEQIEELSMDELFYTTALAERVLDIHQQIFLGALAGGDPFRLRWLTEEEARQQEIERKHAQAQGMVQEAIDQKIGPVNMPRGSMGPSRRPRGSM